jgi:hypothetical protein
LSDSKVILEARRVYVNEVIMAPKVLARRLGVSTATLCRYEEMDLIPELTRKASNRRCYTVALIHKPVANTVTPNSRSRSPNPALAFLDATARFSLTPE